MNQPVAPTVKFYSTQSTKDSAVQNQENHRHVLTKLCTMKMQLGSKLHFLQMYRVDKLQLNALTLKAQTLFTVVTFSICHLQCTAE